MGRVHDIDSGWYYDPPYEEPIPLDGYYDPPPLNTEKNMALTCDEISTHVAKDKADEQREIIGRLKVELASKNLRITGLEHALKEAERFMAYFAGETGGSFVGPGTPQSCLAQIRRILG